MADGYVLNRELKDAVQRMVQQYASSFQARPKRGRRPRRSAASGGDGTVSLRRARVVVEIPAATGHLVGNWGQVEAAIVLCDETTGELVDPESPLDVVNEWDQVWLVDAKITVNTGYSPARVENGTCREFVDWDDEDEE